MRRFALILISSFLIAGAVSGMTSCAAPAKASDGRIRIIAAIFPEYDWTREIIGDELLSSGDIELSLLIDNGVDPHSFEPTIRDIMDITSCDVFIYNGGESDEWVNDIFADSQDSATVAVNIMELLDGRLEFEDLEDGEEPEYDEHIWLSVKRAIISVDGIKDVLCEVDPAHARIYESNARAYKSRLEELDSSLEQTISSAVYDVLIFGDRFPFRYMCKDYSLEYYAAFEGCEAETEASFNTVMGLAAKADETGVPAILIIDGSDGTIARTVIDNTEAGNQEILTLDSMQSVTNERIVSGENYISIIQSDLQVLEKALGAEG